MESKDLQEFIILLLIENLQFHDEEVIKLLGKYYDCKKINKRYGQLIDKFLKDYALNKSEKSE